jgi:hypothetical protein
MGVEDTRDISHQEGVRKGEEQWEGQEPGRKDTGSKFKSDRPTGESDARDFTSVDPNQPITEGKPKG